MMRKFADLRATVGTWKDTAGKTHKRRISVGVVMRDSTTGRMSIRIEAIPVCPEWKGWLSVVPCGDKAAEDYESK